MAKTIIYIMSDLRSGSTLLENVLSNAPNILSVGELHHLNSYLYHKKVGRTSRWKCSCGKSFENCVFWSKIISTLKDRDVEISKTAIIPDNKYSSENSIHKKENKRVIKLIDEIYSAIFHEYNINYIIDSSKTPWQGMGLYSYSDFNIKIIYLKRDIRAVTLSKLKWTKKLHNNNRNIYKTLKYTKSYDNEIKKYIKQIKSKDIIKVKYEQLAKSTNKTIKIVTRKYNMPQYDVPEYMEYNNKHSVGGTPNRFEKSKIKYDSSWIKKSKQKPIFHIIGKIVEIF
jgi:hypothetical protein